MSKPIQFESLVRTAAGLGLGIYVVEKMAESAEKMAEKMAESAEKSSDKMAETAVAVANVLATSGAT